MCVRVSQERLPPSARLLPFPSQPGTLPDMLSALQHLLRDPAQQGLHGGSPLGRQGGSLPGWALAAAAVGSQGGAQLEWESAALEGRQGGVQHGWPSAVKGRQGGSPLGCGPAAKGGHGGGWAPAAEGLGEQGGSLPEWPLEGLQGYPSPPSCAVHGLEASQAEADTGGEGLWEHPLTSCNSAQTLSAEPSLVRDPTMGVWGSLPSRHSGSGIVPNEVPPLRDLTMAAWVSLPDTCSASGGSSGSSGFSKETSLAPTLPHEDLGGVWAVGQAQSREAAWAAGEASDQVQ